MAVPVDSRDNENGNKRPVKPRQPPRAKCPGVGEPRSLLCAQVPQGAPVVRPDLACGTGTPRSPSRRLAGMPICVHGPADPPLTCGEVTGSGVLSWINDPGFQGGSLNARCRSFERPASNSTGAFPAALARAAAARSSRGEFPAVPDVLGRVFLWRRQLFGCPTKCLKESSPRGARYVRGNVLHAKRIAIVAQNHPAISFAGPNASPAETPAGPPAHG